MEVASQLEGLNHAFAVRHVSQNAELKLAVVSDDELLAGFRHECLSDLVLVFI